MIKITYILLMNKDVWKKLNEWEEDISQLKLQIEELETAHE